MKERIAYAIEHSGKTQPQIADEMGVRQQSVSQWVNGESLPRTNKLEKLAKVCGVSPAWLFAGTGAMVIDYSEADMRKQIKDKLENADIPTLLKVIKALS